MNDHHLNRLRILPITILVIFILGNELCQQVQTKDIILDNEEDVIISILEYHSLNVKCDFPGTFKIIQFEWKKISNNDRWSKVPTNQILNRSQWLSFETVSDDNQGQYSCLINGFNGNRFFSEKRGFVLQSAISSIFSWPDLAPRFERDSMAENIPLSLNGALRLDCPFQSTSDTILSWYKNDKLLVQRKAIIEDKSYIENEYNLKLVKLSDAGNYTCVVRNNIGSVQHTFAVDVYEDGNKMPISFDYPRDWSLKSGDTARFYCRVFYYPNDEYNFVSWYFSNSTNLQDIPLKNYDFSKFKEVVGNFNVTMVDYKLILDYITINDAGRYFCVVERHGRTLVASAKLDVDKENVNAPKFTKLDNMHTEILESTGKKLQLECEAKGNPLPNITWYKDGVTPPQRQLGIVKYTQWKIILDDLVTTDSGNYTCKVGNEHGFIDFTYEVKI